MAQVLIIGASGGIGAALLAAHRARGDVVTGLSRSVDGFDITDEDSVAQHLGAFKSPFDRIIVATGGLQIAGAVPEKSIKAIRAAAMADQFALNAIGPALVLAHAHRLLPRDRPACFAALSARVGSIGDNRLGGWVSYRAAKAALNQILRTAAIELGRSHRQACVLALHPGTVATTFTQDYQDRYETVTPEIAAQRLIAVMGTATAQSTGSFRDYSDAEVTW